MCVCVTQMFTKCNMIKNLKIRSLYNIILTYNLLIKITLVKNTFV